MVIAVLSDGLPYALAAAASSDTWGKDLGGRYLIIKVVLQLFMVGACTFPLHLYWRHKCGGKSLQPVGEEAESPRTRAREAVLVLRA